MKLRSSLLFALLSATAAAFSPYVTLNVSPADILVTETAEATVEIFMPRPFRHNPSVTADFIPQGSRLSMTREQVSLGAGTNAWRYVLRVPIAGSSVGEQLLGPVTVSIPTRTDFFGFVSRTAELRSGVVRLMVTAPPEKGRPRCYCGAIASDFRAVSSLGTSVCQAGDPLLFTLELSGATDAAMVHAPPLAETFRGTPFKLDAASLKTETLAASKRFTWRVRALKAGTMEFPAIDVAWFDAKSRTYRTIRTDPIPIQVKAGEQAALSALDEIGGETDEFPMPDGLDLSFPAENFTLRHALSLAMRAESEKDFRAAAERYASFLDTAAGAEASCAAHWTNLGALYVMGGQPREAMGAYARAEHLVGATAGTVRGLKAAIARIKNDPRAELPLPRIMFPFWFRLSLKGRILFAAGVAFALVLLFWAAFRAGRRLSLLVAASGMAFLAQAWPFGGRSPFEDFFGSDFSRMRLGQGENVCPISAKAWFSSTVTTVGEPVELAVTVNPGSVRIEPGSLRVDAEFPDLVQKGTLRNDSPNVYKLRVSFLESGTNNVPVAVSGTYSGTYCVTNGNMISTGRVMNQPFRLVLQPVRIAVAPLPARLRPPDFCGAVGTRFKISQKLVPDQVHPGDLVTADYRLEFDGYCPSNAYPRIENLSRDFKAYEAKEVGRDGRSVQWRQILVPRTTSATNSALVSFSYYNPRNKRYERTQAAPQKLTFVSAEASSTENTRVMVNDADITPPTAGNAPAQVELRFAPGVKSPVVTILPPGEAVRETGRWNGWRRLESERGAGWTR